MNRCSCADQTHLSKVQEKFYSMPFALTWWDYLSFVKRVGMEWVASLYVLFSLSTGNVPSLWPACFLFLPVWFSVLLLLTDRNENMELTHEVGGKPVMFCHCVLPTGDSADSHRRSCSRHLPLQWSEGYSQHSDLGSDGGRPWCKCQSAQTHRFSASTQHAVELYNLQF